jgi:hypothetical protein
MRVLRTAAAILALGALLGCYKHTIRVGDGAAATGEPKSSKMELFFIYGLLGEASFDVKSICPSGNAVVKVQHTFLDGLLNSCSSGLITPTHVEVWCGGETAEKLPDADIERLLAETDLEQRLFAAAAAY